MPGNQMFVVPELNLEDDPKRSTCHMSSPSLMTVKPVLCLVSFM